MRRLVAIFVAPVLVALLVMGGCGPLGTRRSTDPSITADELQTRAVLGTIDEGATTDALERSRDAIDLSVALGNRDEAVGAAQMHLRAARAGLATTRIEHGEGPELRRAARALERGCRLAIDVGRWAGVPWLVAEASLSSPHPRRHRSDLRWAMRRGAYLDQRFDLEQARSMVQRDPLARFRLEEAAHEDDVAREDDGETAGLDLDRLGPAGLDARIARLGEATEHETEVAAMRDMARALGELDPTEPGAALVSALLAEADAGRISPDPQLLSDVAGPSRGRSRGSLARMRLRRRAYPRSRSLALAEVWVRLQSGLVGDAAQTLHALGEQANDDGAELEHVLGAMVGVATGDMDAAARHLKAAPGGLSLDRFLAGYDRRGAPARVRGVAAAARRRLLDAPEAMPSWRLAMVSALDPRVGRRRRRKAARALSRLAPSSEWILAICRDRDLEPEPCVRLAEARWSLYEAHQLLGFLHAIDGSMHLRSQWLGAAERMDRAAASTLGELLPRWAGTRIEATAEYQVAALRVEIARGDLAGARDRLRRFGNMLGVGTRLWARLAISDLDSGLATIDGVLASSLVLPSLGVDGWSPPSDALEEAGRVGVVKRGLALVAAHETAAAEALLAPVIDALDGPDAAVLAARLADLALRDGDEARARRWCGVVQDQAPRSAVAAWLRGASALRDGELTEARAQFGLALRRAPELDAAYRGYVATLAEGVDDQAALRFIDAARSHEYHPYDFVVEAWRDGELDDAATALAFLEAVEGDGSKAWALGPRGAAVPAVARHAVQWSLGEIESAADTEMALARAKASLTYLETMTDAGSWLEERIWLSMLTGRTEAAVALAKEGAPDRGFEPASDSDAIMLLLRARARGDIDDALALAFWRWRRGNDEQRVDALLERPPQTPDLLELACQELVGAERIEVAVDVCTRAWRSPDPSWAVAVNLSYTLLSEKAEDDALLARVLDGSRRPPPFDPMTRAAPPTDATVAHWYLNRAVWLGRTERHDEAAEAWWQAHALGATSGVQDSSPSQLRQRGPLVRLAQIGMEPTSAEKMAQLAYSSLSGGDLVAARGYAGATRALAAEDEAQRPHLLLAERVDGATRLAAADLEHGRIDVDTLADAAELALVSSDASRAELLHQAHPRSALVELALLAGHVEDREMDRALPVANRLLEDAPTVPLVLTTALPVLVHHEESKRARALYAAGRRAHPSHAGLAASMLPEVLTGPREKIPGWARDPSAFAGRLDAIDEAALLRLEPRRRFHTEVSAESFFPAGHAPRSEATLGSTDGVEGNTAITSTPRASRCQGRACAEPFLDALKGHGLVVLWMRDVVLPFGGGTEALLAGEGGLVSVVVVPSGARVFQLVASAPYDRFEAFLPVIKLLRTGFAPLDVVLPSFRTAALEAAGARLPEDLGLRGRLALLRSRGSAASCPVGPELEATTPARRAELLLDLFLMSGRTEDRRALLGCTVPHAREARRLALVTLLDEDAAVHRFGRRATAAHPSRVVADVAEVLSGPLEPAASAPDTLARENLPPHGLLEVMTALPLDAARSIAARLLDGRDRREHALAWIASGMRPGLVVRSRILEAVREGPASEARLALVSMGDRIEPDELATARTRLDTMHPTSDRDDLELLHALALLVARSVEPEDRRRLSTLGESVRDGDDADFGTAARRELERIARDHRRALVLRGDPSRAEADDARALSWIDASKRRQAATPARESARLRESSLAELLPGPHWSYARVGNPGLFGSTVADLARRLRSDDAAGQYMVDQLVQRALRKSGFAVLLEGGGLDLARPIECARPAGSDGFVCTATVSDRDRLLSELGQRAYGNDSGIAIPLGMATTSGFVPVALSATPLVLHTVLHREEEPSDTADPEIAAERFRASMRIAGFELDAYSIVRVNEHRVSLDIERYLIVGDRLWVFSTYDLAERVLLRSDALPLARHDAFERLTRGWKRGSALQAVSLGLASPLPDAQVGMEVVVDGRGLSFRYASSTDADVRDISAIDSMLPDGAVTTLAAGLGSPGLEDMEVTKPLASGEVAPPFELLNAADAVALGWYPPSEGGGLWARWVAVARLDPDVRKAARALGLPLARTVARAPDGLHVGVREDLLVLGSDRGLVETAYSRDLRRPPPHAPTRVAFGRFDGSRAASAVRDLELPEGVDATLPRFVAAVLGLVAEVSFDATWDRATRRGVLEGHLQLELRTRDETGEVIDRWLAAKEARNAGTLPRRLGNREVEGTLVYEIEVADPERFVRSTVTNSPRLRAEIVGPRRIRLTVRAEAGRGSGGGLSKTARARLLESTAELRSDDPRLLKISRTLVRTDTTSGEAAERILRWVHDRIDYEVTPRSLSGVEILDAGRGDCTEYARLTVALLRASGIPAEVRHGMAASGDEIVAHAWVAYHDGKRWHEIDPTWGRMRVTAGHLEISVIDVLALISMGDFEIRSIAAP